MLTAVLVIIVVIVLVLIVRILVLVLVPVLVIVLVPVLVIDDDFVQRPVGAGVGSVADLHLRARGRLEHRS